MINMQRRELNRRGRSKIRAALRENQELTAEFQKAIEAGETLEEQSRVFVNAWNEARANGARFFDANSHELRSPDATIQAMLSGQPIYLLSPEGVPAPIRKACDIHRWRAGSFSSSIDSPGHPAAKAGHATWEECEACDAWRPLEDLGNGTQAVAASAL